MGTISPSLASLKGQRIRVDDAFAWRQAAEKIVYSRTLAEPRSVADADRARVRARRSAAAKGRRPPPHRR